MLHAIFIGIDEYDDASIPRPRFAAADARTFGKLVEEKIEPSERHVRMLLDEQATRDRILDVIGRDLARSVEWDDIVLIYFAGMGAVETIGGPADASRYLLARDSQMDRLYATAIDVEKELSSWKSLFVRPKLTVIFLDACFSGVEGGRTVDGPALRRLRKDKRHAISLKKLDVGKGFCIIAACEEEQGAFEDEHFQHGIFTYYLLEALTRESPGQKTVSLFAVYDEVADAVKEHTGGDQTPTIKPGNLTMAKLPRLA